MVKKKILNRLGAGALSLIMAFSGITTFAAVVDSGNPIPGTNGHSEFSWYASPTHIKDVYKVSMEMDVYVKPTKAEIVIVLDNSGSMGRPYDLSPGVWQGANQPDLQKKDVNGNRYFIPETAYTHNGSVKSGPSPQANVGSIDMLSTIGLSSGITSPHFIPDKFPGRTMNTWGMNDLAPMGAYSGGEDGHIYDDLTLGGSGTINFKDYEVGPYRLEWVRTATATVLDELLLEENNPLNYDQIKISIIAFGGARTQVNTTNNPLYWNNNGVDQNYDGGTVTNLPAIGVAAGGDLDTLASTTTDQAITYQSVWIDNKNVKDQKKDFLNKYVRRNEDTFLAAGLETAMLKFDDLKSLSSEEWAPENRHVFVLADGGDNSTADMGNAPDKTFWQKNPANGTQQVDPTRSLAAAAKLKSPNGYNAKISTVGVLESAQHDSGKVGSSAYLNVAPSAPAPGTNSFAERHLLLLAAPLNASAKQFQSGAGYYGNGIAGTGGNANVLISDNDDDAMLYQDYGLLVQNDFTASVNGDGYGAFSADTVANLASGYGPNTTGYTYARDEADVFKAFSDFTAQFKESASNIRIRQKLTNMFEVYKMPDEPLYTTTNGTVRMNGRDIEWDIDTVSAKGGTVTLSYYVKFDSANADPSMHYPMAESTYVTWNALGNTTARSNFPSVIINGNTSGNGTGWTINNNNTGMNATGDSQSSTIGATGNVLTDMGSSNAAITGTGGTATQGSGGGVAFLGAGPTVYTASVANTSAAAKKKTKSVTGNSVETLSDSEYKAVKGQSLKTKSSKVAVYEEPKKDSKALLYLNKGKTFKIAGATDSYYMIQYKKKDGKVQKGYILKSDVSLVK